jgi:pimeloyl-ACP methyl ester carboxylesterase
LLVAPARDVGVKGKPVHLAADAHLFYNFAPADDAPEDKPIIFLFNGFADDIVRPYGTGPMTVEEGGAVVKNPASLTRFVNLVYLEPRQAGYSYDTRADGPPGAEDCSPDVFNEYVDASDVLFAALAFLSAHRSLTGPVYWLGESYGGVRVTWILTYLHRKGASLAGYRDPMLDDAIAASTRDASALGHGQILLEAWLAGGAHTTAIAAACADAALVEGVEKSLGAACSSGDACVCASAADKSPYDYLYSNQRQNQREWEADLAHTKVARADALLGVKLASIAGLDASERGKGFKCSAPDDTVPPQDELVAALGALPNGQAYFVPYSPLEPGKELVVTPVDWETTNAEAFAFVDALADVPALLTQGDRDLVVPTRALAPALASVFGASAVHASRSRITVDVDGSARHVDVFDYPDAGHMITMVAPAAFARDLEAWMAAR